MTTLVEPFAADFMVRAALGLVLLGIAAPLCGCWVLQRRLVYLSDAMSHAVLAGVAGAALLGASLLAGAFVAAVVMALGVAALVLRAGVAEDAAIGVSGQALFALGLVGVSIAPGESRPLAHILFGNPLTLTWADLRLQAALTAVVVLACLMLLPVLVATTVDGVHARTVGVPVARVDTCLVVGLGLVVVLGLTTVGVLLAVSMLVLPAVAARLLCATLHRMLVVAVLVGVSSGLAGLLLSYHTGLPTGPVVVLAATALVAVSGVSAAASRTRLVQRCAVPHMTRTTG